MTAIREVASRLFGAGLDLLYPPRCVLCGRNGDFLCASCIDSLPRADGERCERCWLPLNGVPSCVRCLEHPTTLRGLRSVWRYELPVRRLVHKYKFSGQSCLADPLAAQLEEALQAWSIDAGVIVPVPLTPRRRRERGFNQSMLLAERLARSFDLPAQEALSRIQTKQDQIKLTAVERRRNVEGVFALRAEADVVGRTALLIDDVATTGATLNACARVLLEAGARDVYGLTIARED